MTTRAKKVRDAKADSVWFKFGKGKAQDMQEASQEIGKLAKEGQNLKTEIKMLQSQLADVNAKLLKTAEKAELPDSGTVNVEVNSLRVCSIKYGSDTIVSDAERLRKRLGDDLFDALTRLSPKPKCLPTKNLMERAARDKAIMDCLDVIEKKPSVTYNV